MKKNGKINLLIVVGTLVLVVGAFIVVTKTTAFQTAETVDIATPLNTCDPNVFPLRVASKNGYFAKENINVNLADASGDLLTNLNNGKSDPNADVLVMGRGEFYRLEDKHPGMFKIFAFGLQDKNKWNDAIIVRRDSGIASLGQLQGKTIGISFGDARDATARVSATSEEMEPREAAIRTMLEKNGLDPAEFPLVSANLAALENNTISALHIREPFLTFGLHSGKYEILEEGPIFARYVFNLNPWAMSVSGISSEFTQQKPETAKKIVQVWDQSVSFIRENPAEADTILQECMKENFGLSGATVRQLTHWKSSETDKNLVQQQLQWYYSIGVTSKELNVDDILLSP